MHIDSFTRYYLSRSSNNRNINDTSSKHGLHKYRSSRYRKSLTPLWLPVAPAIPSNPKEKSTARVLSKATIALHQQQQSHRRQFVEYAPPLIRPRNPNNSTTVSKHESNHPSHSFALCRRHPSLLFSEKSQERRVYSSIIY